MQPQQILVPYALDVIAEIDKIVDQGTRTEFLVQLARREIKLRGQMEALSAASGAWKSEDHPELADRAVWDVTVFTKNRDRLLKAEVARKFFDLVVEQAKDRDLMAIPQSTFLVRSTAMRRISRQPIRTRCWPARGQARKQS